MPQKVASFSARSSRRKRGRYQQPTQKKMNSENDTDQSKLARNHQPQKNPLDFCQGFVVAIVIRVYRILLYPMCTKILTDFFVVHFQTGSVTSANKSLTSPSRSLISWGIFSDNNSIIRNTSFFAFTSVECCSFCAIAGLATAAVWRATSRANFHLLGEL